MTELMASVRDAAEAEIAARCGVDWALLENDSGGWPSESRIQAARAAIGDRVRLRVSIGAGWENAAAIDDSLRALHRGGVEAVHLAIEPLRLDSVPPTFRALARDVRLVGALRSRDFGDLTILDRLAALGFSGATLKLNDELTWNEPARIDIARLSAFCMRCRALGLASGLAGALEAPDAPRLLLAEPDFLGFAATLRAGAAGDGAIDEKVLRAIRDLAPRGKPSDEASSHTPTILDETDVVFVRDFAIDASVGAYGAERKATQRVVFTVEAMVKRPRKHSDDMRAVFSYDIILDAIRMVVARGHHYFVETLAEEVAAIVLKSARVTDVRIRIEKPGVIAGAVGVEIRRRRNPACEKSVFAAPPDS